MLDEATNPEQGVAPEVEAIETDQADTEAELTEEPETEEEFEEVDYDGERFSVPKKLKPALMMQADYTKKTQELSVQNKTFEEQRKQFQQEQENKQTLFKEYVQLEHLNTRLEQFKEIDWDKLTDEDPVQALKLDREYRSLVDQRNQRAYEISQKEQARLTEKQSVMTKQVQEGKARLERDIKDYGPELENNLKAYAKRYEVNVEDGSEFAMFPGQTRILHKAYLYDQLIEKQAAQKSKEQPEIKPIPKVKTSSKGSAPTEFRSDMTDAQYDAWRARNKRR